MKYEANTEPTPDEKRVFLQHVGFRLGSSKVRLGARWLGGYEEEDVYYRGVDEIGRFLASESPRGKRIIPYPASSVVSYRLLD